MRLLGLLCLMASLPLTGCDQPQASSQQAMHRAQGEAIAELALASLAEVPADNPAPDTDPSTCSSCQGTGRVGDGRVFQTCLDCDGTGKPKSIAPAVSPSQAKTAAKPRPSAYTPSTILVCHGSYCSYVPGKLHESGNWFYDAQNQAYRRQTSGVWKAHQPTAPAFPNSTPQLQGSQPLYGPTRNPPQTRRLFRLRS